MTGKYASVLGVTWLKKAWPEYGSPASPEDIQRARTACDYAAGTPAKSQDGNPQGKPSREQHDSRRNTQGRSREQQDQRFANQGGYSDVGGRDRHYDQGGYGYSDYNTYGQYQHRPLPPPPPTYGYGPPQPHPGDPYDPYGHTYDSGRYGASRGYAAGSGYGNPSYGDERERGRSTAPRQQRDARSRSPLEKPRDDRRDYRRTRNPDPPRQQDKPPAEKPQYTLADQPDLDPLSNGAQYLLQIKQRFRKAEEQRAKDPAGQEAGGTVANADTSMGNNEEVTDLTSEQLNTRAKLLESDTEVRRLQSELGKLQQELDAVKRKSEADLREVNTLGRTVEAERNLAVQQAELTRQELELRTQQRDLAVQELDLARRERDHARRERDHARACLEHNGLVLPTFPSGYEVAPEQAPPIPEPAAQTSSKETVREDNMLLTDEDFGITAMHEGFGETQTGFMAGHDDEV